MVQISEWYRQKYPLKISWWSYSKPTIIFYFKPRYYGGHYGWERGHLPTIISTVNFSGLKYIEVVLELIMVEAPS